MNPRAQFVLCETELATQSPGIHRSYYRMCASAAVNRMQISAATPVKMSRLAPIRGMSPTYLCRASHSSRHWLSTDAF